MRLSLTPSDAQAGIECPMTAWEDWVKRQDWKEILAELG